MVSPSFIRRIDCPVLGFMDKFACFSCRKCFKIRGSGHAQKRVWSKQYPFGAFESQGRLNARCPDCKAELNAMGHDFKAPPRSNLMQWRKIELLYARGWSFYPGFDGPGFVPHSLSDVKREIRASARAETKVRVKR